MTDGEVAALYDELVCYESRSRPSAYPIHKRLKLPGGGRDVYDLVADAAPVSPGSEILDAGCGVGFGTIRLAQSLDCNVHGISLSEQEIAIAQRNGDSVAIARKVSFECRSFDDVASQRYDSVVAIESLKHSDDIGRSVDALMSLLRSGGSLFIVDDFYTGSDTDATAARMARAWRLPRLYRLDDLRGANKVPVVDDLTQYVRIPARLKIALRRIASGLVSVIPAYRRVAAIFNGGLDLESLYRRGDMRYLFVRLDKSEER